MIVNLKGYVDRDGYIIFDLVPLYFSGDQTVHVNELYMQFSNKLSNVNGFISTSLIDKSPVNQEQNLLFFYQGPKSSKQFYYAPTHLAKYKIEVQSLQAATFKISAFEGTEKISFRKTSTDVYLQLEIETNARLFKQSPATY